MKSIFRNSLLMLAAGAFAVSCADYNVTDNFTAEKDPSYVEPYKDLGPVKSYIDRVAYPNMSLGATLDVKTFNDQTLAHAAAVTNFDNLAFGKSLMSGSIINAKGVMDFAAMKDLLDHVYGEIYSEVFGSPIAANANQADNWYSVLTAPIEIRVDPVEGKTVNYNDSTAFHGTKTKGSASIVTYDKQKVLKIDPSSNVYITEGFEVDSLANYTVTFWAKADKKATFSVNFSGTDVEGPAAGRFSVDPDGLWKRISVDAKSASGVTEGFLRIDNTRATALYVRRVEMTYLPDNHRSQTPEEIRDTMTYALNTWCDGLMKNNAGRIKLFDLIDEPIGTTELENGMLDLRHTSSKVYWQDVFGSENYAPKVSNSASAAFARYDGNPADLKFFISETGLEEQKKFESLMYWIGIWDAKGAKIDGINAKMNLTYSEDATTQAANKDAVDKLLDNLATTGKLIRLSNFDIKYQDADGNNVSAKDITAEQRQKLADYYAYVIKRYMEKIPHEKQLGICKGNLSDTGDPVGLWAVDTKSKDWVRTATYEAFCNALSGK